jgi:O-Antigen ligase
MRSRSEGLLRALAWLAFASVCALPFLSGGVYRWVWIPVAQFWLGLGLAVALLRSTSGPVFHDELGALVSRALHPIHGLFLLQLVPFPALVLSFLSSGSHAAHFLPDPGDGRWRPLSVSPAATVEAWLYVAGLQGVFLALQGFAPARRRGLIHALLATIIVLAGVGLWQSRSSNPHKLYGRIEVEVPEGFKTAVFGPYLNRNHFATPVAVGTGVAAGLAAGTIVQNGGLLRLLRLPSMLARVILLSGVSGFLALAGAASGSRSGALAAIVALGVVGLRAFGKRVLVAALSLGVIAVVLTGSATFERLLRLNPAASRWDPWVDMANLLRFFPVFGSGVGTFAAAYWPYQRNAPYEFWQFAHNDYLQWAIEGGLAGLLAAAVFSGRIARVTTLAAPACIAAAFAFATQAALDFPSHVPASAAVIVALFALGATRRLKGSIST